MISNEELIQEKGKLFAQLLNSKEPTTYQIDITIILMLIGIIVNIISIILRWKDNNSEEVLKTILNKRYNIFQKAILRRAIKSHGMKDANLALSLLPEVLSENGHLVIESVAKDKKND